MPVPQTVRDPGARPLVLGAQEATARLTTLALTELASLSTRRGLVLAVDGLTGSGKSVLARALLDSLSEARLLSTETLVPGWDGLAEGVQHCATLLRALDQGRDARARTWDWEDMAPGGEIEVKALEGGILVLEGCGTLAAAAQSLPGLRVLRVALEAPEPLRHQRITQRDPYSWDVSAWESQERAVARAWQGDERYGPDVLVRQA